MPPLGIKTETVRCNKQIWEIQSRTEGFRHISPSHGRTAGARPRSEHGRTQEASRHTPTLTGRRQHFGQSSNSSRSAVPCLLSKQQPHDVVVAGDRNDARRCRVDAAQYIFRQTKTWRVARCATEYASLS